jgi:hypothetical protein
MPKAFHHFETGLLLKGQRPVNLALEREDGGVWQLDANAAAFAFDAQR